MAIDATMDCNEEMGVGAQKLNFACFKDFIYFFTHLLNEHTIKVIKG